MNVKKLIGRKIVSVSKEAVTEEAVTERKEEIFVIEFEDGKQRFLVEGDCCSCSWVEHLTVQDDLNSAMLISVEDQRIDSKCEEDHAEYDYLQVYETRFRTNRGDIVLEYRNSSNGYYGGSINMIDAEGRIECDYLFEGENND